MAHESELLATIAAGLGLAFVFGLIAARMRLPPIVGYLLAGVVLGPFTPGFVGDAGIASRLAEVGVILLMFGVGLHFSLSDLAAVKRVAVPGAAVQILVATALGAGVARFWGWSWASGVVFGLCLSVASTVVLLRALEGRGTLDSRTGRLAVGWLIVEDLFTVLILVLLPLIASLSAGRAVSPRFLLEAAFTLAKVAAFVGVMHVAGRRAVPWILGRVARTGSRELFTLGILAIALGVAVGAAALFGVSLALGAFFAGVVISDSDWSHRAAADSLPLQDAFAVLFFVSVGMLFDPRILIRHPEHVLLVVLVIVVGKALASVAIARAFRLPAATTLTIAAGLSQIGEFSFILVELAISLGLLVPESRGLVLAGALVSITVNPFLFGAIDPLARWLRFHPRLAAVIEPATAAADFSPESAGPLEAAVVVVVGYGRVGATIGAALKLCGIPFLVVEQDRAIFESIRRDGIPAIYADAARPGVLEHARVETAIVLVVATPEFFQAREVLAHARRLNPEILAVSRTHSAAAQAEFDRLGRGRAFLGESELAFGMTQYALEALGRSERESEAVVEAIRAKGSGKRPGAGAAPGRTGMTEDAG